MTRLVSLGLAVTAALFLGACGGSSVGHRCETHQDCDNGQTCYADLPGGYCSKGCNQVGSVRDCPSGTICSAHAERLLCAPICQTQSDCREGYECNGISGTDVKSCRPNT